MDPTRRIFTVCFEERHDRGYAVSFPAFPGLGARARDLQAAREAVAFTLLRRIAELRAKGILLPRDVEGDRQNMICESATVQLLLEGTEVTMRGAMASITEQNGECIVSTTKTASAPVRRRRRQ